MIESVFIPAVTWLLATIPMATASYRAPRSIIECTNQVLGETIGVAGTPFALHYMSDRVPGRRAAYELDVPLDPGALPGSVQRIDLEVQVAGRRFVESFTATPGQTGAFAWDGLDAFGRLTQGKQPYQAKVGWVYDADYGVPPGIDSPVFGLPSTGPITGDPAREEVTLWRDHEGFLGTWDALATWGLGGWSLSPHHVYDAMAKVLYYGDGRRRKVDAHRVVATAAGTGTFGASGDGGRADQAELAGPADIELSPAGDGGYYFVDYNSCRVRKVDAAGVIRTVAGTDCEEKPMGDGGPATSAWLASPRGIGLAPDGTLYIADTAHQTVRRVSPDGTIATVAGYAYLHGEDTGDTAATAFALNTPMDVEVGPDGHLYVASDNFNLVGVVTRYAPDGSSLTRVAGGAAIQRLPNGSIDPSFGNGGKATDAWFPQAVALDFGPDGSLYIADPGSNSVWQVTPLGMLWEAAGGFDGTTTVGYEGDTGPATDALFNNIRDVAAAPDGSLYIADADNHAIRMVDPFGIVRTIAGTGEAGFNGFALPAVQTQLNTPVAVALAPEGDLLVSDHFNQRVRKLASPAPNPIIQAATIEVASEDGSAIFVFDKDGRHLSTKDAQTGQALLTFAYDEGSSLLAAITDAFGNVTTIERGEDGAPEAIVGPFGQRTELTTHPSGYLATATNPAGESVSLAYSSKGLLTQLVDPKNRTHTYSYDPDGRLERDTDPASGFTELERSEGYDSATRIVSTTVTKTSALGQVTTYLTEELPGGAKRQTTTGPDGVAVSMLQIPGGARTVTYADGSTASLVETSDPRFGMQAPVPKTVTLATPGGLTQATVSTQEVTARNPQTQEPTAITSTLTVNGRTTTSVRDLPGRKVTVTTPGGRVGETFYDAFGRVTESRYGGLAPVTYAYDARGRVETVSQGSRTTSYDYGTDGLLASVTDPLSREVSFARDPAGRVTRQTLPDGREVTFTYDPAGNLTSITPPGRPAHAFTHTVVDLPRHYTAPDAGAGADVTTLDYDLDRRLTRVTRPGGETIDYSYHPLTHRLSSVTTPEGVYGYSYDAATGNLTAAIEPDGGSLAYTYDGSLPLAVAWSGEVAGSVEQTYDPDFRVVSRTVNGLDPVAFAYEADGFLTQAGALTLDHDPASGLLTGTTLDTITDALTYNAFGEPTGYTASYSGADFYAVTYTRDAAGRIASKTETIGGVSDSYAYTYDLAGRLTEVTKNGAAYASYTYDANSNRTAWTDPWGSGSATYDAQDRLLTHGGATYTYAPGGELATKTANGQTATFDYDALGNLRSVVLPDGIQIDYVIDAANRRVGKKINGTLVQGFLYGDQLNPVAELDGLGAVVSRFVYGTTGHVPDYMVKAGVTYRLISDHLGSVRLVVNAGDGTVAQRLDYDAYGRVLADTNPGFQPFGFAGGIYDYQTGLVRFGARDYDPETGRWTAKDPIGFAAGDTNLYGYVLADPINAVDPSGLKGKGGWSGFLDDLQVGLDVIGLIPAFGEIADIANGFISLARKDCIGATLSFAGAVPFAGWAATGAKWGRRALKYSDEALLASRKGLTDLPVLDATGKVHGQLPDVMDLGRYDVDELIQLRDDLKLSVQKRIEVTVQKGSDFGHAQRQAAEQQLIKSIEKHLENR